jgi:hypothetical protein
VVGRRALLLGGGAAILAAGCGKDVPTAPPAAEPALLRSLTAERALGAAMATLEMRLLSQRSRERSQKLASTLSERGGDPHEAPDVTGGGDEAVPRGRRALEAYVSLLPTLQGRDERAFGADLLAQAAADVALMGQALGTPPDDAFPGTPS